MKKLFDMIKTDTSIVQAITGLTAAEGQSLIYGVTASQKSLMLSAAFKAMPRTMVVVAGTHETIDQLERDLSTLLPDVEVVEMPVVDVVNFTVTAKSTELFARKMNVLGRIARGENIIVLVTAQAAIQKVPPRREFLNSRLTLGVGEEVNREQLLAGLVALGYERVDQVEGLGQFCARGGIVDVFAVNHDLPLRLELFGDEIDSLREFEPATQRSVNNLQQLDILPLVEPVYQGKPAAFVSYLPANSVVVFDEPARIREHISQVVKENPELKRILFSWAELAGAAKVYPVAYISLMLQKTPGTEPGKIVGITAKAVAPFQKQMEMFVSELRTWLERRYSLVLLLSSRDKALALQQNLARENIKADYVENLDSFMPETVVITTGFLTAGFELPQARLAVITELDIFGRQKKKPRLRVSKERKITYFRDINIGDYVVHVNHGIGKYVGVETLDVGGIHKDYLHIRYAGEDKLYVPTDQVHLLQKYIGAEGEIPRLHKMGGSDWLKTKTKARAAVADIAKELVALYAQRQVMPGFAFEADTPWQKEFEDAFLFEETPDQLEAVREIKADMERPRPMDRLLCGDVGFGKTEVAIRAAFKAVMSGKQVAVLVPTTVLAQQHYQTFSSRMAGFGPTVDVISRFRSPREQRETLSKLVEGQVDILIGTHRLLNSDVVFKDIGLLIVDEEQRFGVTQKEKLKKWSAGIDVLTLSATPIPRTLHMSLVGARDMSIIETPPENRFPVQTYVVEYNDDILREAIKRELKRSGQVYFVYNRVQTIDKMARHLSDMLPDAKIKSAHGQMPEELLEQIMLDFYEGEDDILVCTSIIENGLDVPNANTIIVYDADYFGLSQLYQMRGRVGRSHRMAFAYFTYRRDKVLTEVAEKRLQAIKEFTELGAGFKIAMRDLEIRGAGNLLGAQQHGHIVSVGFEMYCHMLNEAIHELKTGRTVEWVPEPVLEFNMEAYISGDYINDAMHKIEIYQRIAASRNEQHLQELLDELIDRFGEPPQCVMNLLTVARIKNICRRIGIRAIIQKPNYFDITFQDKPNVEIDKVLALQENLPGRLLIFPGPPESMQIKTFKIADKNVCKWLLKQLETLAAADGSA
ncbi:hypothetical protein P22_2574 [Propionispora sp. 2/2-37]|uniref:transcription-repair coupling factor n=1 Tax=Propionispora sp. 2/2-37 TaxID=1677858 RepID=UPI0006BB640E|nr:transcription-repair coupling factor [Propionispora sp. 2/2-37]CUH96484.1 hypothetical protein P22_2574 [Propionispora sp. 2/2-37]